MNTSITADEIFSRQVTLLGQDRQNKIRNASVLVVGVGGLGCPALQYLASAGVGRIGIADHDHVAASNLQRQILFHISDIDKKKVTVAAQKLKYLAPFTDFQEMIISVNESNVIELISSYDIILDCTDNFHTKFLLHDASFLQKKILIQASVYQYEGQLHSFDFRKQTGPCLRCLWAEEPQDGCTGTCADVGVIGPLLGVLGSLQAMEALKKITSMPSVKNGESIFVDLMSLSVDKRRFKTQIGCVCCEKKDISLDTQLEVEMPVDLSAYQVVDVRSISEHQSCIHMSRLMTQYHILNVPLSEIENFKPERGVKYLLVCEKGLRSLSAARILKKKSSLVFSLSGGVSAFK